jgi:hypothetical protein
VRLPGVVAGVIVALGVSTLGCQSNDTPKGPLASCDRVAEILATLEVGNYAPREQRVASEDHHRQACAIAMVTEDEAKCLSAATSTWSAAACVPRMFPKPSGATAAACKDVATRVRQAIQVDVVGSDARTMIEKMMPAMEASCIEDTWPASLVDCIRAAKPGDLAALERCNTMMPKELQDRLQQRMMQAGKPATP